MDGEQIVDRKATDMATILVVDDERMICDLMRTVLSRHGHLVVTAAGGREALELFQQHRPRITLLDLRMPEMDGIAVLKQIRAMEPQASVIVLTGATSDSLEYQALEMGVTDFLRKGLSLNVLERTLARALQPPVTAATLPSPGARAPVGAEESASILVVDDEQMVLDMLKQYLTGEGYQVRTAGDGGPALALVEREQPQMIILDLNMPGLNGIAVLRQLRAMQYRGGTILLTGSEDEKLLLEALDLGSMDVIGKPIDLERLLLSVQVGLALSAD